MNEFALQFSAIEPCQSKVMALLQKKTVTTSTMCRYWGVDPSSFPGSSFIKMVGCKVIVAMIDGCERVGRIGAQG